MKLSDYRLPTTAEDGRRKTEDKIRNGFTLVELLVVITIMALVGTFTLSNYGSFGEDQKLKNAVLDIQSLIRLAQTNATTNVKCNTEYGAKWIVEFDGNKTTIYLKCLEPSGSIFTKKTLHLDVNGANIQIQSSSGDTANCSGLGNAVVFAPLNGEMALGQDCTFFTFTLINKIGTTKDLRIEKGGRIYAQ